MSCSEAQAWVIGDSMNFTKRNSFRFQKIRASNSAQSIKKNILIHEVLEASRSEEIQIEQFWTLPAPRYRLRALNACDL
jgi:hypothetical protein